MKIVLWVAQLTVAGILGMNAFVKFFNYTDEGSKALADALDVGRGVITMIGVIEAAALVLILTPRVHSIGALLAVLTMLGALFSHATKIGWSGSAVAEMWPLAIVVLACACFVLVVRRKELPMVGQKL